MLQSNSRSLKKVRELLRLYQGGAVFTAFDTETTGLNASSDRLLEIGAVKFNKDGVMGIFNQLINPCRFIPAVVTQVNNITMEMVRDCPTEDQVLPSFIDFISDTILLAHNANFDLKFVNTALSRCGYQPMQNMTEDTVHLSKAAFPELPYHKLQFLAQQFRINPGNAHRAQDDARVCMEVFFRCLQQV
ncbi:MAG: 3'-5' exonuclease [Spirochaetaceae bacterium]|nr:3'-5' exonuclease [Spirochaetaceae bacterium]